MVDADPLEKLLWALVPGMASFLLGAMWQSWRATSSESASQLNDLLKEIRAYEDLATEYWTAAPGEKEKQLEVKIRGTSFAIAAFESQIDKLFHNHASNFRGGVDLLNMCYTGGEFETGGRKMDAARAIEGRRIAAEVAATIRLARQDSAGLKAIFWEAIRISSLFKDYISSFLSICCDFLLWPFAKLSSIARVTWSKIPAFF